MCRSENAPPDPGDQHLWDLLAAVANALLVTGDLELLGSAPAGMSVQPPRAFLQTEV